jgi:hypothetical protein
LAPYVLSDPAVIEGVDCAVSRLDFVFCTPQLERPKARSRRSSTRCLASKA